MKMLDSLSGSKAGLWPHCQAILAALLWIVMASAMIVESDSYRYATIILVVAALIGMRDHVRMVSRNWLAILCYAWAAYVLVRFLYGVLVWGEKGTSEWLYVFPVFFPFVGVALHASRRHLYGAATLFLALSLLALLFSLNIPTLLSGARAAPLFHNNPIHAGVGCGMIFLCAVFWLLHSLETGKLRGRWKWPLIALGFATATASLLGALGAQSKGVWLALAATAMFLGPIGLYLFGGKWRLTALVVATAVSTMIGALAFPYVHRVAGPTIDAVAELIRVGITEQSLLVAIQTSIDEPNTPSSMHQRLKLISNAIEVYQDSPLVGSGNLWLIKWKQTTYGGVPYTLIHNGYLEVMVRHGLLGMTVMGIFILTAVRTVNLLYRTGHISASLVGFIYSIGFFFFCTIATNSNNRLALGESFFLLAGGAMFALIISKKLNQT